MDIPAVDFLGKVLCGLGGEASNWSSFNKTGDSGTLHSSAPEAAACNT